MKRIIREQWGRWCLVLSLVWAGLVCVIFPAQQGMPGGMGQQASSFERLQVAYQPESGAAAERVFPEGRAEDYRREGLRTWTVQQKEPLKPWPVLDAPSRASIRPVVLSLPDPGPSLNGADRLPVEERALPLPRIEVRTDAKK